MKRSITARPVTRTLVAAGVGVCVFAAVAVPLRRGIQRETRMRLALHQLDEISLAKEQFANRFGRSGHVQAIAAADLVPAYLTRWPTSPPDRATYAANALGSEPTVNGLTKSQILAACKDNDPICTF